MGRPSSLGGSSARKPAKSSASNFLVGAICQSTGPSFDFNSSTPLAKKRSIDWPGLGQHAAVGRELRTFEREHEIVGRLGRPFAKAIRLLRPVEGGVDLDRGELAAGVFQL